MSLEDHSPKVVQKAESLLKIDGAVEQDGVNSSVWWVRPRSGVCYRVQQVTLTSGLVLWGCSCPHGANEGRSAYCYHVAAVKLAQKRNSDSEST